MPEPALNLGCGPFAQMAYQRCGAHWVNVDRYNHPDTRQPDVIANAIEGLPFDDGYFERAYLGHLLEHLKYTTEVPAVLREVRRVCQDGAQVAIVGPCHDKAVAMYEPESLVAAIRPAAEDLAPPGINHQWLPTTAATLRAVLLHLDPRAKEVSVATVRPPDWPNVAPDALWQCAIRARVNKGIVWEGDHTLESGHDD